jgi:hypothetical protein
LPDFVSSISSCVITPSATRATPRCLQSSNSWSSAYTTI